MDALRNLDTFDRVQFHLLVQEMNVGKRKLDEVTSALAKSRIVTNRQKGYAISIISECMKARLTYLTSGCCLMRLIKRIFLVVSLYFTKRDLGRAHTLREKLKLLNTTSEEGARKDKPSIIPPPPIKRILYVIPPPPVPLPVPKPENNIPFVKPVLRKRSNSWLGTLRTGTKKQSQIMPPKSVKPGEKGLLKALRQRVRAWSVQMGLQKKNELLTVKVNPEKIFLSARTMLACQENAAQEAFVLQDIVKPHARVVDSSWGCYVLQSVLSHSPLREITLSLKDLKETYKLMVRAFHEIVSEPSVRKELEKRPNVLLYLREEKGKHILKGRNLFSRIASLRAICLAGHLATPFRGSLNQKPPSFFDCIPTIEKVISEGDRAGLRKILHAIESEWVEKRVPKLPYLFYLYGQAENEWGWFMDLMDRYRGWGRCIILYEHLYFVLDIAYKRAAEQNDLESSLIISDFFVKVRKMHRSTFYPSLAPLPRDFSQYTMDYAFFSGMYWEYTVGNQIGIAYPAASIVTLPSRPFLPSILLEAAKHRNSAYVDHLLETVDVCEDHTLILLGKVIENLVNHIIIGRHWRFFSLADTVESDFPELYHLCPEYKTEEGCEETLEVVSLLLRAYRGFQDDSHKVVYSYQTMSEFDKKPRDRKLPTTLKEYVGRSMYLTELEEASERVDAICSHVSDFPIHRHFMNLMKKVAEGVRETVQWSKKKDRATFFSNDDPLSSYVKRYVERNMKRASWKI